MLRGRSMTRACVIHNIVVRFETYVSGSGPIDKTLLLTSFRCRLRIFELEMHVSNSLEHAEAVYEYDSSDDCGSGGNT